MLPIVITGITSIIQQILGRVLPETPQDKIAEINAAIQAQLADQQIDKAQIDVNIEQAKSDSLFVSGPRPFIMWGTGSVLVLYFLMSTGISFAVALGYHVIPMPSLDPMLRDIILGLLGLGYLTRSYDKKNGK